MYTLLHNFESWKYTAICRWPTLAGRIFSSPQLTSFLQLASSSLVTKLPPLRRSRSLLFLKNPFRICDGLPGLFYFQSCVALSCPFSTKTSRTQTSKTKQKLRRKVEKWNIQTWSWCSPCSSSASPVASRASFRVRASLLLSAGLTTSLPSRQVFFVQMQLQWVIGFARSGHETQHRMWR